MGTIVAPFGVQGWVKIKTDCQDSANLVADYKELYLFINQAWQKIVIDKFFVKNNILHAKIADIDDRDAAMALKGSLLGVPHAALPKLADDEYYWVDLIGLTVINKHNEMLGVVENLMETGANPVLIIKDNTQQRLIPFVAQYIISVDLANKQIIAEWELDY